MVSADGEVSAVDAEEELPRRRPGGEGSRGPHLLEVLLRHPPGRRRAPPPVPRDVRQLLEAHFLPAGYRSGSREAPEITLSPYAEGVIPLKNYFDIEMPLAFQRLPKFDPRKPPKSDDGNGKA